MNTPENFVGRIYNVDGVGYDLYISTEQGKQFYNLVPINAPAPDGGYYDPHYIFKMKGF